VITGLYPTSIGTHHMCTGKSEVSPHSDGAAKPAQDAAPAIQDKPDGIPVYSVVLPEDVKPFPEYLRKAG
jgi:N-sulfoglucosamine sulfohydrolase